MRPRENNKHRQPTQVLLQQLACEAALRRALLHSRLLASPLGSAASAASASARPPPHAAPAHHLPALNARGRDVGDIGAVPSAFVCPLSLALMLQPVVGPSGVSYDRPAIESYVRAHGHEPGGRAPMAPDELYPNVNLRDQVHAWLQAAAGGGGGGGGEDEDCCERAGSCGGGSDEAEGGRGRGRRSSSDDGSEAASAPASSEQQRVGTPPKDVAMASPRPAGSDGQRPAGRSGGGGVRRALQLGGDAAGND
jgi:hypothetical protein